MKKTFVLLLVLIMLSSCVDIKDELAKRSAGKTRIAITLPSAPGVPGTTVSADLSQVVGKAVPGWARNAQGNIWAAEPRGLTLPQLINNKFNKLTGNIQMKISGYDFIYSRIYYTNTNYILGLAC